MKTVFLGAAASALLAVQAAAQDIEQDFGEEMFGYYCATCHGPKAAGDGEMVPFLTLKVPDLTGLALDNGGTFPMGRVIMVIDGRSKPKGHVGPMPYFGPMFMRETIEAWGEFDSIIDTNGRILLLAKYLEAMQRTAEP